MGIDLISHPICVHSFNFRSFVGPEKSSAEKNHVINQPHTEQMSSV